MGWWEYKYETKHVGEMVVDGESLPIYSLIGKKDKWVPNFIVDPILGIKGGYVFDPTDMEPPTEKETVCK
jgi:hypothetical protein